jgi:CYTH domain-containing protein
MDHEVSMAQNSLKSIVIAAGELMNKMGEDEKDIPAWIQDHITNAANYIRQASENYHEYSQPEHKDGLALEDLIEAKRQRK